MTASGGLRARLAAVPGHDVLIGLLVIIAVFLLGGALSGYQLFVVTVVVIYAVIGASHTVLFGAAGQPSVGHAALLGAGAYTAVAVGRTGLGIEVELLVGVLVGATIGTAIGLPSLRIGSLYLAIATLALSVVAQQIFFEWHWLTGGGAGTAVPPVVFLGIPYSPLGLLYIALVVLGLNMLAARNLLRGRHGRAWHALRTSPLAASSVGIALGRQKLGAFALAGAMVGCAGVLFAHAVNYVSPEDFTVQLSIMTLVVAIVGGQRYLWGAVCGAVFIEGVPELLRAAGDVRFVLFGIVFVLVMLFFPGGFAGGVAAAWRRLRPAAPVPGLSAGTAATGAEPPEESGPGGAGVVIHGVSVVFGGVTAVDDVSIDVAAGSVVGLVGPNGAGKTTLLNAVSGFAPTSGGTIEVGGVPLRVGTPADRRRVGVGRTFQNLSLHEGLTVLDHLLIGQHSTAGYGTSAQLFRLPGFGRAERRLRHRALAVAAELGLSDVVGERVENLPYGIQKRVDVARAVAATPRVLLLDEPAAGLTPDEGEDLVLRVLALTRRTGATVLLVEHNIELVMQVADRVVALNFGRVIADDVPEIVRGQDDFVEAYLGS